MPESFAIHAWQMNERRRSSCRQRFALTAAGVLSALVYSVGPAQAASVTITAPTATGAPGAEVSVPIRVTAAPGLGALHLEVTFDPTVLEGLSATGGALAAGGALVDSNATPGRLVIGVVSSEKIDGDGEIVIAKFRVLGAKGSTTPLGLEKLQAWEGTLDRLDIQAIAAPGSFTVTGAASSFPWWIVAVAAALLLIILFFLLKRRKKDDEPASPPAPAAASSVGGPPSPPPSSPSSSPSSSPPSSPPSVPRSGPPSLRPGEFRVTVAEPVDVVDGDGLTVGTLAPATPYTATHTEGEWTEVKIGDGTTGWVPAVSLRRL